MDQAINTDEKNNKLTVDDKKIINWSISLQYNQINKIQWILSPNNVWMNQNKKTKKTNKEWGRNKTN